MGFTDILKAARDFYSVSSYGEGIYLKLAAGGLGVVNGVFLSAFSFPSFFFFHLQVWFFIDWLPFLFVWSGVRAGRTVERWGKRVSLRFLLMQQLWCGVCAFDIFLSALYSFSFSFLFIALWSRGGAVGDVVWVIGGIKWNSTVGMICRVLLAGRCCLL